MPPHNQVCSEEGGGPLCGHGLPWALPTRGPHGRRRRRLRLPTDCPRPAVRWERGRAAWARPDRLLHKVVHVGLCFLSHSIYHITHLKQCLLSARKADHQLYLLRKCVSLTHSLAEAPTNDV